MTDFDNAVSLLEHLEDQEIPAFIAGGFLRDQYLGGKWRDIDIYVPANHAYNAAELLQVFPAEDNLFGRSVVFEQFSSGDVEYDHQYIQVRRAALCNDAVQSVWGKQFEIDIVGIDSGIYGMGPEAVVRAFNTSLAQSWMDWNGQVQRTAIAEKDFSARRCTVLREDWGKDKTAANIRKLKDKYPDLPILMLDGSAYNEALFLA